MKVWTRIMFAAILLASIAASAQATTKPVDAKAAVKASMKKIWETWSTKDVKAVSAFYAKDVDAVFFDVAPLKYKSWAEYEKGVQNILTQYKTIMLSLNDDAQVHMSGSTAWGTATISADFVDKDSKSTKSQIRWTVIWQKRGGKWLVVHEHVSEPLP